MRRSTKRIFAASMLFLCVLVAYVWAVPGAQPTAPTLSEGLGMQISGMPTRLYSGALDSSFGQPVVAADQSWDVVQNDIKVGSFLVRKDGSSRDAFYRADGQGLSYVSEYYANDPITGARRVKGFILYAANGKVVRKEIWWRLDGTREKEGHLLDPTSGRYETLTIAPDGRTMLTSRITEPNPYANNYEPKLIIEKRWYTNARHTLSWVDSINDDGTREMTSYDENENPVMTKHVGLYPPAGTIVKYFFPGTTKVRMEGEVQAGVTLIKRYRENGTVLYMSKMDTSMTSHIFLDEQGKPLFEQTRWQYDDLRPKGDWALSKLVEFDDHAAVKRELVWNSRKIKTETLFNATVDGVFYEKVIRTYREDGTLEHVDMIGRKAGKRSVDYTVADNIRAVVPADELVPPEAHPDIPYPEAQSMEH